MPIEPYRTLTPRPPLPVNARTRLAQTFEPTMFPCLWMRGLRSCANRERLARLPSYCRYTKGLSNIWPEGGTRKQGEKIATSRLIDSMLVRHVLSTNGFRGRRGRGQKQLHIYCGVHMQPTRRLDNAAPSPRPPCQPFPAGWGDLRTVVITPLAFLFFSCHRTDGHIVYQLLLHITSTLFATFWRPRCFVYDPIPHTSHLTIRLKCLRCAGQHASSPRRQTIVFPYVVVLLPPLSPTQLLVARDYHVIGLFLRYLRELRRVGHVQYHLPRLLPSNSLCFDISYCVTMALVHGGLSSAMHHHPWYIICARSVYASSPT